MSDFRRKLGMLFIRRVLYEINFIIVRGFFFRRFFIYFGDFIIYFDIFDF